MGENIVLDRVTSKNKSECCDSVACNGILLCLVEVFEEINYDNAPDILAGMGYTLCDTE